MDELDELVPEIKAGKCLVFIGAGVSYYAGCQPWENISKGLFELFNEEEQKLLLVKYPDLRNKNLREPEKIQIYKEHLGRERKDKYKAVLSKVCTPTDLKDPKFISLTNTISKLTKFYKPLITTNIDNSLQGTNAFDRLYYPVRFELPEDFKLSYLNELGIVHIHGYIENFAKSIFTQEDYDKRYIDPTFREFIIQALSTFSVLFIGYSFNDKELQDIFSRIKAKGKGKVMKYYRLVSSNKDFEENKIEAKEKYNVNLINYGQREELAQVLTSWVDKHFGTIIKPLSDEEIQNI
ncbi:SIR2 family protein [Candidatus Woesebacteria bacterium]|nr:SIR2 family protein [Candidatus Woesebacteria bacterium]